MVYSGDDNYSDHPLMGASGSGYCVWCDRVKDIVYRPCTAKVPDLPSTVPCRKSHTGILSRCASNALAMSIIFLKKIPWDFNAKRNSRNQESLAMPSISACRVKILTLSDVSNFK